MSEHKAKEPREGLPPCGKPSSICGTVLFFLSVKDNLESIEKHEEENKNHVIFTILFFMSALLRSVYRWSTTYNISTTLFWLYDDEKAIGILYKPYLEF